MFKTVTAILNLLENYLTSVAAANWLSWLVNIGYHKLGFLLDIFQLCRNKKSTKKAILNFVLVVLNCQYFERFRKRMLFNELNLDFPLYVQEHRFL